MPPKNKLKAVQKPTESDQLTPTSTLVESILDRSQDMHCSAQALLDDVRGTGDERADKGQPRRSGINGTLVDTSDNVAATQNILTELRAYLVG